MMVGKIEFRAELLRRLHRVHQQRFELESELERGPKQVAAAKAQVERSSQDVEAVREKIKQAKMASDQRELQLKSREAKIEELKGKLNSASSNREFDLLKEQIAADQQANEVLSDEILEGLEQIDQLHSDLSDAEKELENVSQEQKQRITRIETRMDQVRDSLEHVNGQLVEAEAEIPGEAKTDYVRLTKARGAEALAPVEEGSCGGCAQTLTTQTIEKLRLSLLVQCSSCSAFLYLPE